MTGVKRGLGVLAGLVLAACQAMEPGDVSKSANGADSRLSVTATRIFAGPGQYPPAEFKAYGILAFPARATSATRARHIYICEAYLGRLPHTSEAAVPRAQQMVTVWPVRDSELAGDLNAITQEASTCAEAVDGYGLVTAQAAIKDAQAAGHALDGRGPYLLAWSPAHDKGKANVPVLVADLTNVSTAEGAQNMLNKWAQDIEKNPQLWNDGWDLEKIRLAIQLWVDRFGRDVLALKGGS